MIYNLQSQLEKQCRYCDRRVLNLCAGGLSLKCKAVPTAVNFKVNTDHSPQIGVWATIIR